MDQFPAISEAIVNDMASGKNDEETRTELVLLAHQLLMVASTQGYGEHGLDSGMQDNFPVLFPGLLNIIMASELKTQLIALNFLTEIIAFHNPKDVEPYA